MELQEEVIAVVQETRQRSGWPARRTLKVLDVTPASYYRWRRGRPKTGVRAGSGPRSSLFELLESERQAIREYALKHPEIRHRELAWRMLDDGAGAVSASSVYRVLKEAGLVCRWKPKAKRTSPNRPPAPERPDELWQTDLRYTQVGGRNYFLLSFLDAYSRYVVYHELLPFMDGRSVSLGAAAALATLPANVRPTIQSDHGSGFIAREFVGTLAEAGVGHSLIRPHTPTDNALIERYHRTIGEKIDEYELEDFAQAQSVIAEVIADYNHRRLHSALSFLRPVDYYRGNPKALLAERRGKLTTARELRKQENIRLRQRLIPFPGNPTVTCSKGKCVSL